MLASSIKPEHHLQLQFGLGATLLSLYNYINPNADRSQTSRNTQSSSSLTHISEIQEDHLKQLNIELANNRYFHLQSLKFNPAIFFCISRHNFPNKCYLRQISINNSTNLGRTSHPKFFARLNSDQNFQTPSTQLKRQNESSQYGPICQLRMRHLQLVLISMPWNSKNIPFTCTKYNINASN